jgi:hypothetical protein
VKGKKNGKESKNDEKPTAFIARPTGCDGRHWGHRCALNDHLLNFKIRGALGVSPYFGMRAYARIPK